MRISHLFCDGCGKEVVDDGTESTYTLALSERIPKHMGSNQFLIGPEHNPSVPELCNDCGSLLKTLLRNQSIQKVLRTKNQP